MTTEEMSIEQMEAHLKDVAAKLEEKRKARLDHAVATIQALAKEAGLGVTIEGMPMPAAKANKPAVHPMRGEKVPPKFRDPNTGKTWSGRGMRPNWMNGGDPEQFRI